MFSVLQYYFYLILIIFFFSWKAARVLMCLSLMPLLNNNSKSAQPVPKETFSPIIPVAGSLAEYFTIALAQLWQGCASVNQMPRDQLGL